MSDTGEINEIQRDIELEKKKQELLKEEIVKIIMRQTDYTREQAEESFNRNKTIEKCIEEYLGYVSKKDNNTTSTNQAIYSSIRNWLS
jgi:hypothetical protein